MPHPSVVKVFQEKNLEYLTKNFYAYAPAREIDWEATDYYKENQDEFEFLISKYGSKLQSSFMAPTEVRFLGPELGWGLFALEDLGPEDLLGEYTGVVDLALDVPDVRDSQGNYASDFAWNYPADLPDGRILEISALKKGNELRFVNHSFTPNVVPDHTVIEGLFVTFFRVVEPIPKGSQILVNYGEEYWSGGFRTLVIL